MAAGILDASKVAKQSQVSKNISVTLSYIVDAEWILVEYLLTATKYYQVVRCCIEHAAVVAKSFLTSDVVIVEAKEGKPIRIRPPMPPRNLIPPMPASSNSRTFKYNRYIFISISNLLAQFTACFQFQVFECSRIPFHQESASTHKNTWPVLFFSNSQDNKAKKTQ